MSCYTPKRKTDKGIEDVKLPINSINGLEDRLATIGGRKLAMPIIRLANVLDSDNTMIIGPSNPLKFCVEIIDGSLQVGDTLQILHKATFHLQGKEQTKVPIEMPVERQGHRAGHRLEVPLRKRHRIAERNIAEIVQDE